MKNPSSITAKSERTILTHQVREALKIDQVALVVEEGFLERIWAFYNINKEEDLCMVAAVGRPPPTTASPLGNNVITGDTLMCILSKEEYILEYGDLL